MFVSKTNSEIIWSDRWVYGVLELMLGAYVQVRLLHPRAGPGVVPARGPEGVRRGGEPGRREDSLHQDRGRTRHTDDLFY